MEADAHSLAGMVTLARPLTPYSMVAHSRETLPRVNALVTVCRGALTKPACWLWDPGT